MPLPRPAPGTGKWWGIGIAGVAVGVALAVWLGLSYSVGQVTWTDTGYRVIDDRSVQVDFDVHRPGAGRDLRRAGPGPGLRHRRHAGGADPGLPGGLGAPAGDVRTTTRAVTGVVRDCRGS